MISNEIFRTVIEKMRDQYPHRNISIRDTSYGTIVSIDGEDKFNITGYCLLYNLQRLCKALKDELD